MMLHSKDKEGFCTDIEKAGNGVKWSAQKHVREIILLFVGN